MGRSPAHAVATHSRHTVDADRLAPAEPRSAGRQPLRQTQRELLPRQEQKKTRRRALHETSRRPRPRPPRRRVPAHPRGRRRLTRTQTRTNPDPERRPHFTRQRRTPHLRHNEPQNQEPLHYVINPPTPEDAPWPIDHGRGSLLLLLSPFEQDRLMIVDSQAPHSVPNYPSSWRTQRFLLLFVDGGQSRQPLLRRKLRRLAAGPCAPWILPGSWPPWPGPPRAPGSCGPAPRGTCASFRRCPACAWSASASSAAGVSVTASGSPCFTPASGAVWSSTSALGAACFALSVMESSFAHYLPDGDNAFTGAPASRPPPSRRAAPPPGRGGPTVRPRRRAGLVSARSARPRCSPRRRPPR